MITLNGKLYTQVFDQIPSDLPAGMVLIPDGTFVMGNSIGDLDIKDAKPVRTTVSAFYMDANLVCMSQWQSVYNWAKRHGYSFVNSGDGANACPLIQTEDSYYNWWIKNSHRFVSKDIEKTANHAPNHPVHTVNWYDCVKWCNARSEKEGKPPVYFADSNLTKVYRNGEGAVYAKWSASGYRLPTEAEWEMSARGGVAGQRFPWGNTINQNQANYYGWNEWNQNLGQYKSLGNLTIRGIHYDLSYDFGPFAKSEIESVPGSRLSSTAVGTFPPNGYGLYDMAGNVSEWCWDSYCKTYAGGIDPHGPLKGGDQRVFRGGEWCAIACTLRCAQRASAPRAFATFEIGFRTVLPLGKGKVDAMKNGSIAQNN